MMQRTLPFPEPVAPRSVWEALGHWMLGELTDAELQEWKEQCDE